MRSFCQVLSNPFLVWKYLFSSWLKTSAIPIFKFTHYILGHNMYIQKHITINVQTVLKWNSLWLPIKTRSFFSRSLINWIIWCGVNTYSILFHGTKYHAISYGLSIWLTHTHTHTNMHNDLCLRHEKCLNINSINAAFEIERLTCKCINICGTYCSVWRARCNDILLQAEALHLLSSCGHKPRSHKTQKVRIMWRFCDQQRWTYSLTTHSMTFKFITL